MNKKDEAKCPSCGSNNHDKYTIEGKKILHCLKCSREWDPKERE